MILLKKKKCCELPPEDVWCRQGSVSHKQGHSPGVCSWTQLGITAPNVDVAGYERKCQSWLGTNQKRETWGCPGNATTATSWLSLGTSMRSMREDTSHSRRGNLSVSSTCPPEARRVKSMESEDWCSPQLPKTQPLPQGLLQALQPPSCLCVPPGNPWISSLFGKHLLIFWAQF